MAVERLSLPSGAILDLEVHESPEDLPGVVGHWGEKKTMDDIHQALALQGVRQIELSTSTGFDYIYHQRAGIERHDAIQDELSVAETIATTTLELNGWKPTDVDAVFVGSGVPPVDNPNVGVNYANIVAQQLGMREDVMTHSTYAACTSGAHEFFRALTNPDLQGKKVLILGMENVTTLTPDLDINRADPFSIQVFSNGAAGIGIVPGEDIIAHTVKRKVFKDTEGALAAHMTYERLLDPENADIWQEDDENGLHLIRYPKPQDGLLLVLDNRKTSMLFVGEMVVFIGEVLKEHNQQFPSKNIIYTAAHPASKAMSDGLVKRLVRAGVESPPIPWVVPDGNSSAATTLIAHNRLLPEAKGGRRIMVVGYGAGGSADGGIIEYGLRKAA
ncbi:MAG: hypothetical protein HY431_02585 [Candidatus Levybacteria bacterium]|nr:hypothetical protein [Candidatus Levybacteria bacterium]